MPLKIIFFNSFYSQPNMLSKQINFFHSHPIVDVLIKTNIEFLFDTQDEGLQ